MDRQFCLHIVAPDMLNVRTEQRKVHRVPLLGVYAHPEFVISHGKTYIWDTEGGKYLDFSAGIAVNS